MKLVKRKKLGGREIETCLINWNITGNRSQHSDNQHRKHLQRNTYAYKFKEKRWCLYKCINIITYSHTLHIQTKLLKYGKHELVWIRTRSKNWLPMLNSKVSGRFKSQLLFNSYHTAGKVV